MTNPRVTAVEPLPHHQLKLQFSNGEVRVFDATPYLDKGIFSQLKDEALFRTVKPLWGSVTWAGGQDFCPDTLYLESTVWQGNRKDS